MFAEMYGVVIIIVGCISVGYWFSSKLLHPAYALVMDFHPSFRTQPIHWLLVFIQVIIPSLSVGYGFLSKLSYPAYPLVICFHPSYHTQPIRWLWVFIQVIIPNLSVGYIGFSSKLLYPAHKDLTAGLDGMLFVLDEKSVSLVLYMQLVTKISFRPYNINTL
jgi:hypothetical protein